ncbi:unnamed protein product [Phyllotreta striolata]|uniref:Uncharacterized protein n=1 Tax=Phyllotreta striolata TaxID=444603 RepID=A0A9N9TJ06_PHYSR|nr:unnamed protein product [Phyllotreta striolata]
MSVATPANLLLAVLSVICRVERASTACETVLRKCCPLGTMFTTSLTCVPDNFTFDFDFDCDYRLVIGNGCPVGKEIFQIPDECLFVEEGRMNMICGFPPDYENLTDVPYGDFCVDKTESGEIGVLYCLGGERTCVACYGEF